MKTPAENPTKSFATPAVDVLENDDEFLLLADLPGVAKEDVNIRFEEDSLMLETNKEDGEHVFRRRFTLGQRVQTEGIEAKLSQGVLTVHLPKVAAQAALEITVH